LHIAKYSRSVYAYRRRSESDLMDFSFISSMRRFRGELSAFFNTCSVIEFLNLPPER
jgi:hypothetical protein